MTIKIIMGSFGVGKTHWIKKDLANHNHNSFYTSPKTESFPFDGALLQSYYPDLSFINSQDLSELINESKDTNIYIEIPEYIDIFNNQSFLDNLDAEKIAIISQLEDSQKWKKLVDKIIVNDKLNSNQQSFSLANLQIHRAGLTQEVLDFASLEKQMIIDTISDFCLSDDVVQFYQQQVKESLV